MVPKINEISAFVIFLLPVCAVSQDNDSSLSDIPSDTLLMITVINENRLPFRQNSFELRGV